jgi:hypothetical protein
VARMGEKNNVYRLLANRDKFQTDCMLMYVLSCFWTRYSTCLIAADRKILLQTF